MIKIVVNWIYVMMENKALNSLVNKNVAAKYLFWKIYWKELTSNLMWKTNCLAADDMVSWDYSSYQLVLVPCACHRIYLCDYCCWHFYWMCRRHSWWWRLLFFFSSITCPSILFLFCVFYFYCSFVCKVMGELIYNVCSAMFMGCYRVVHGIWVACRRINVRAIWSIKMT